MAARYFLAFTVAALAVFSSAWATETLSYRVVNRYPHDPAAFTQGLIYDNGVFYESTGLYGQSSLRKVDLVTGKVVEMLRLPSRAFGEGLALADKELYQLTWRENVVFVYDKDRLTLTRQHRLATEGWGIAFDGKELIVSDGSAKLYFYSVPDFTLQRQVQVTAEGKPVSWLNELEFVDGRVLANIWKKDVIAVIDPRSGVVDAWLDLSNLRPVRMRTQGEDVMNGIAYNGENGRLYVTGKRWPVLFELEVPGMVREKRAEKPNAAP